MISDTSIKQALEDLYCVFSGYRIKDITNVSCFDFGPSEKEVAGLAKPLREIPDDVIGAAEFYDWNWSSWGTEQEVKYLLPRVMEYWTKDVGRVWNSAVYTLLSYKMNAIVYCEDKVWLDNEKRVIINFVSLMFRKYLNTVPFIQSCLIGCAFTMGFSVDVILHYWEEANRNDRSDVVKLYKEFEYNILDSCSIPKGIDADSGKDFLDKLCEKLTPDELADIAFPED